MEPVLIALGGIAVILLIVVLVLQLRQKSAEKEIGQLRRELACEQSQLRQELTGSVQGSVSALGRMIGDHLARSGAQSEARFATFETGNEQKLENIRQTVERRLTAIQTDSNQRLDEMRQVVDEKLQKTLESKMTQSFRLVNERLEQVYKGLGEMQQLAQGVGDLKKVLSNVKTRGILGEIQLGAILEEILSPEQYEVNAATKPGSSERVEYAVRLPAEDGRRILLPIDSKFPGVLYAALQDAYDEGNPDAVKLAVSALVAELKKEAKDIRTKYIDPPNTTDFAILFLPFEGLYAEVVNRGLVEELQRSYRVNIAGPSTMAALLNSLQMGFRTFAIQKRSSEVWEVLGAVKTEFERFSTTLASSQKRLLQVNDDLDQLIGVRTRSIVRKLRSVERLDDVSARRLLDDGAADDGPDDEPRGEG